MKTKLRRVMALVLTVSMLIGTATTAWAAPTDDLPETGAIVAEQGVNPEAPPADPVPDETTPPAEEAPEQNEEEKEPSEQPEEKPELDPEESETSAAILAKVFAPKAADQEGHRVLISGSHHDRIAIVDYDGSTIWEMTGLDTLWSEANDADLLPNGNIVYAARNDFAPAGSYVRMIRPAYPETTGYDLLWEYEVPKGAENHTSQALPDGGVLVGEVYSSYVRIVELDPNGNVRKELLVNSETVPEFGNNGGTHGQIRQAHKTDDGHYLLVHFSNNYTVELDGDGKFVASYPFGTGFMADKDKDGNVVIAGGNTPNIKKFSPDGEEIWTIAANSIPGVTLGFPAAINLLDNGNIVLANWGGHGGASGVSAVIEINPETKELVWYMDTADGGNISNVQVIDDMNVDFKPDPDEEDIPDPSSEYRSPLDAVASINTGKVYIADYTNKSIQVIRNVSDKLIAAIELDYRPTSMLLNQSGSKLFVAAGGLNGKVIEIDTETNTVTGMVSVGHTPSALALSEDENVLYVANRFSGTLQSIDLVDGGLTGATVSSPEAVTREPMAMELVNGKLYVAGHLPTGTMKDASVSSEVVVVDPDTLAVEEVIMLVNGSTNMKDMAVSPDGKYIYVTHALGRYMVATTHLDRGWIYTNAVSEIDTATNTVTATMLLDDLDLGAGNPWGIEATMDKLIVSISGTRELMIIDRTKMRKKIDGVRAGTTKVQGLLEGAEDIPNDLTFLTSMKTRINLGEDGPRGLAVLGGKVYTANYFGGSVSVVNINTKVKKLIKFETDAVEDDVRAGERLWNDSTIGFQQWQSCASCHPDARSDALNWDNLNDGIGTPKQARTMLDTFKRGRVMATGIRPSAYAAVRAGLKYIMFNNTFPEEKFLQMDEYVRSLEPEPSPYLVNGKLSESAQRGKELFEGKAGCASCHAGEIKGQDLQIYNYTQSGNESRGLLVPPLREVWRTAPYLCDGSAATIMDVLTTCNPVDDNGKHKHGKVDDLTEQELEDVVEYVLSLGVEEVVEESATMEKLETLYNKYVDLTNEDGKYTETSFAELETALADALAVIELGEEAEQTAIQSAYDKLKAAVDSLIEVSDDTYTVTFTLDPEDAVVTVVNADGEPVEAEADGSYKLKNGEYTYTVSKEGYLDATDSFTVNGGAVNIPVALAEEPDVADKSALIALIEAIDGKYEEERFTAESWAALIEALDAAQAVVDNKSASQKEVFDAYLALVKARDGLVYAVDTSMLELAIELAQQTIDEFGSELTGNSVDAIQKAIDAANELLSSDAMTQDQVNAMYNEVMTAIISVVDRANRDYLSALIVFAENKEGDYTPSTLEALETALASAKTVEADTNATDEDIRKAYDELSAAVTALKLKANKATLIPAVDAAREMLDSGKYDPETLKELSALIDPAELLVEDEEADQDEVNKMAKDLTIAMSKVRLAAKVAEVKAEVEQLDLSGYTAASVKALTNAIAKAEAALESDDYSDEDEEVLTSSLTNALSGLVEIPVKPDPEPDPKPSKPSSSKGGSASAVSDSDYWAEVIEKINATEKGGKVSVKLDEDANVPATAIDALKNKGVIGVFEIGGVDHAVNGAGELKGYSAAAVYYTSDEIKAMAGGAPAAVAPTAPAAGSEASNPETGGEIPATIAPAVPATVPSVPAHEDNVTLAPAAPTAPVQNAEQQAEAPAEATAPVEPESNNSWIFLAIAVIVLASGAIWLVAKKRHSAK